MMIMKIFLALSFVGITLAADLPPQECPVECTCYYFRIHWVTECSHRDLTDAPTRELSSATYVLDLRDNRLEALMLPSKVRPRRLLLANNNFRQLQREQFQALNMLLEVDLSGNRLNVIDPFTFNDSPGLISLNLRDNNHLTGPAATETPFLVSRSLQTLDLANCGITLVGKGFFSSITSLRKVDLSGNPLSTIEPGAFSFLPGLDEVRLSKTKIASLSSAFSLDAPLRVLDLSFTKFDVEDLNQLTVHLTHIENINLNHVAMSLQTETHGDVFSHSQWLQHLNIAGNNLGQLDVTKTMGKLKNLETLDLSYCNLSSNSFREDALSNLTKLRTLKISGNILNSQNMTALMKPFTKLHTLILRNCSLDTTEFLRELVPLRQSLRSLDLSDNPLGNDQVNAAGSIFPHLESLDVSRCRLTRVKNTAFSSATNLVNLAISGNPFSRLERGALASLKKLQFLHMEDCGVSSLPPANVFPPHNKTSLKELRIAGNPLNPDGSLLPQHLSGLTLLDVSRCGLKRVSAASMRYASNLHKLILADNHLRGDDALPANLGSLAPKLNSLDVRRCKLQSLNPNIFNGNDKLSEVFLTGNPWSCNCKLESLWRWATSRGVALQEFGGEDTLRCVDTNDPWTSVLDTLNCA